MTEDEILDYLVQNNGFHYNLHKASEECQELGLVLTQKLLKPAKVDDQEIIDEIGDVKIRLSVLERMYPKDRIDARVKEKLAAYETYLDHRLYEKI
jgi:hypothetical protein